MHNYFKNNNLYVKSVALDKSVETIYYLVYLISGIYVIRN